MKVFVIIFVACLAGTNGQLSQLLVQNALEKVKQNMTESGLDPLEVESFGFSYTLPVLDLFMTRVQFGGLQVTGISNIVLNQFRFNALLMTATFNVSLPRIEANIGQTDARLKLFDVDLSLRLGGSVAISKIQVAGRVRVSLTLGGFSIRSADIQTTIGDIKSNLELIILGKDISDRVNTFFNTTLINSINNNSEDIGKLVEYYILQAIQNS
ncbi:hypothetical protein ABMA27_011504 [Loxostege sticticalis]|uniref:Uncharacterized protein n=1 Tax=Loxostege sticticalis TaxID=481309 RepID=A0ABR3IGJ9_LOXSC